jgi:hypothetical protein
MKRDNDDILYIWLALLALPFVVIVLWLLLRSEHHEITATI